MTRCWRVTPWQATGGVDALAVTHMDALQNQKSWTWCDGYQGLDYAGERYTAFKTPDGVVERFHLPADLSLEQRENFTKALMQVRPLLKTCDAEPGRVVRQIESLLDRPVGLISRGPRAADVEVISPELSIDG